MTGLKILISSSYYWPEEAGSAPYLTGLAEHLSASGHDVVVATASLTIRIGARERREAGGVGNAERVRIIRRWHYVPRLSQRRSAPL